jgi:MoxR-like ATPase
VEEVCATLGAPLIMMKGAEHLEDADMLGGFTPVNGRIEMVYGPLSRALMVGRQQYERQLEENRQAVQEVRAPKKMPPAVLFIDEINRLQSRFLNLMITAMNLTRSTREYSVEIPCNGESISCPEGYFMIVGAQNLGQLHSNTYATDLALDRRFYGKLNVDYLKFDEELALVRSVVPNLEAYIAGILCRVAHDSRYQMGACLRAPVDSDTLLKWAEETCDCIAQGAPPDVAMLTETARDIVFGVCLERGIGSDFDPSGMKILTDNINEAWKNGVSNIPVQSNSSSRRI